MHKKKILLLASAMMVSVLFTGCQTGENTVESEENNNEILAELDESEDSDEAEEPEENEINEVELSDWDGTWNNMVAYLDDEELEDAFKELAEREDMSVEETKETYISDRDINFDGLVVEGNKVIFLDGFKDDNGKEIEEIEYEYKDMVVAKHGNFDTEWYSFEAKEDSLYPVLLLMPVHGEEALTHFHLRYGDSVEELLALEDWYPTFISPNSTYGQIYEEVTE